MVGSPAPPPSGTWRPLLERALAEDLGSGDVTSNLIVAPDRDLDATIEAREALVVCGLSIAAAAFEMVDPRARLVGACADGDRIGPGDALAHVRGPARAVLAAERTALNFLGRLCGVATLTRRFVDAVAGTGAAIVDTRKTLPGWRALDKWAVAVGGGVNHRAGLYDAILVKDNHIAAAGGVVAAVKAARAAAPPQLWIQVEVESEEDAALALEAGADALLLDNRTPDELARIVERFGGRTLLEASGGVTLANVRRIAATGVRRISVGALTHSAPSADVSLEVRPGGAPA